MLRIKRMINDIDKLERAWREYMCAKVRYETMLRMYEHGEPVMWCSVSIDEGRYEKAGSGQDHAFGGLKAAFLKDSYN